MSSKLGIYGQVIIGPRGRSINRWDQRFRRSIWPGSCGATTGTSLIVPVLTKPFYSSDKEEKYVRKLKWDCLVCALYRKVSLLHVHVEFCANWTKLNWSTPKCKSFLNECRRATFLWSDLIVWSAGHESPQSENPCISAMHRWEPEAVSFNMKCNPFTTT